MSGILSIKLLLLIIIIVIVESSQVHEPPDCHLTYVSQTTPDCRIRELSTITINEDHVAVDITGRSG